MLTRPISDAPLGDEAFKARMAKQMSGTSSSGELLQQCTGDLIFDLSILVNDWCSNDDGRLDQPRYDALLSAYLAERPMNADERRLWPSMLRMTALRYWLSRLLVVYVDPPAHSLNQKPHRLAGDNRIAFDPQDVMFICQLLYP